MKTLKKISVFAFVFLAFATLPFSPILAQATDSTAATGPVVIDSFFGITLPAILKTAVISLLIILPAVQLVLKRIPTDGSVKIQGLLGKVLDFLTFFQKDKIKS